MDSVVVYFMKYFLIFCSSNTFLVLFCLSLLLGLLGEWNVEVGSVVFNSTEGLKS